MFDLVKAGIILTFHGHCLHMFRITNENDVTYYVIYLKSYIIVCDITNRLN